jgi:hypothetical protein
MKVNAKVGGVNTCWSVLGTELLRKYFNKEVSLDLDVCTVCLCHGGIGITCIYGPG